MQDAMVGASPPSLPAIRPATRADMPAILNVLCRAFDADPVMNWLLRQDGRRAAAFHRFFRLSLSLVFPHGQVFVTEDLAGVALWSPPGRWGKGRLREVWQLPGFIRSVGLSRLPRILPEVMALEARHPTSPPHYYLFDLAVDPPAQGRGIGSALLRHVLEACDRGRIPAYLENSNPRNTPLYERHGFRVTEEVVLASGPPVWLMWREPMTGA